VIVRALDDRVELITQPDHAQLAYRIMERCVPLAVEPRRTAILHAIGEHDNGWAEEDAAPTLDPTTGRVADFVYAPVAARQAVWPRGVKRLASDPWAAALVAQHSVTVYDRYRPDPDWSAFFDEMEATRDSMLNRSGLSFAELSADYRFVRLADLTSLAFCTGWRDEQAYGGWTVRLTGSRVLVSPDPFGGATIPIEIGARAIPKEIFRSDAELRDAIAHAKIVTLRGDVG
jgi:hypothetical protein